MSRDERAQRDTATSQYPGPCARVVLLPTYSGTGTRVVLYTTKEKERRTMERRRVELARKELTQEMIPQS